MYTKGESWKDIERRLHGVTALYPILNELKNPSTHFVYYLLSYNYVNQILVFFAGVKLKIRK